MLSAAVNVFTVNRLYVFTTALAQPILSSHYIFISDRRMSKDSNVGDLKSTGNLILRWYGVGPLPPQQEQELQKMNDSVVRRFNESVMEKLTGFYFVNK